MLKDESVDEFEALLENLRKHYDPVGALEEQLIADIADATWIKRRVTRQYSEAGSHTIAEGAPENLGGIRFPNYEVKLQFLQLFEKLAKSDGVDIGDPNVPLSTESPSARSLWTLLETISPLNNSNPTASAFDQIARPSDLEQYLKLIATLDKRIEKDLTSLARSKLFRKEFAPKLVQPSEPQTAVRQAS